jgi:hypothetical protein
MESAGRFQRPGVRTPELVLATEPVTFAPPTLPGHRMLRVQLRNDGPEAVELRGTDLDLIDAEEHSLHAASGFGRTISSATVAPGAVVSLDFVWRARPDAGVPARLRARGTVVEFLGVPQALK